jgi:hypothetical protein
MARLLAPFVIVFALLIVGTEAADHPIVDKVADKVIQKYQTSTCEQLRQEQAEKAGKPKPEMEQRAIQLLHEDAAIRTAFFNKVSAPIVTKLFECTMIP